MSQSKALLCVHGSVLLFGASGLFVRLISLPPVVIAFGRVVFSAITLFLFALARKDPLRLHRRRTIAALAASGALLAIHWSLFFLSIELTTVAIGTITFTTFPLFVAFLEPVVFREKFYMRNAVASIFILIGMFITVPQFSVESQAFWGIAAGLLSSLAYAALTLVNRSIAKTQPGSLITLYEHSFAALFLAPCLLFVVLRPTARDVALLAVLGVFITALGHTLFISTLKGLKARTVSVITSMEAVYGIALALVLLGEIPTVREIIGGAIIIGTVVVNQFVSKG